jgi:hypothetical protein
MVAIAGFGLRFTGAKQFTSLAYAVFSSDDAPSDDASMTFAEAAMESDCVGGVGEQKIHSRGQSFVALVLQANRAKKDSKFGRPVIRNALLKSGLKGKEKGFGLLVGGRFTEEPLGRHLKKKKPLRAPVAAAAAAAAAAQSLVPRRQPSVSLPKSGRLKMNKPFLRAPVAATAAAAALADKRSKKLQVRQRWQQQQQLVMIPLQHPQKMLLQHRASKMRLWLSCRLLTKRRAL